MRDILKPVLAFYGRKPVKEFGPLALKAIRQTLVDKGLVRRRIKCQIHRIRPVFKWGVENELVPPLVLEGLRAVAPLKKGRTTAPESRKVKPVPDEHVDAVLPLVSRQVAAMIELQRLTGMRPGEVVLMRPGDIDRSGSTWVYVPMHHKTDYCDHRREVPFGEMHVTKLSLSRANHDGVSLQEILCASGLVYLLYSVFNSDGKCQECYAINPNWTDILVFTRMDINPKFRTKAVVVRAIETVIADLGPQSLVVACVQRGVGLDLTPAERPDLSNRLTPAPGS